METREGIAQAVLKKYLGGSDKGKSKRSLAGAGLHALKVPGFKKGGKVKKTGIYKLHKGETVVPTGKNGCKCSKDSSAAMVE